MDSDLNIYAFTEFASNLSITKRLLEQKQEELLGEIGN